jgi:hypothetical protein
VLKFGKTRAFSLERDGAGKLDALAEIGSGPERKMRLSVVMHQIRMQFSWR